MSLERTPEPELMDEVAQARAYAEADFEAPHNHFVTLLREAFSDFPAEGHLLDLGCGPGDVTLRVARAFPACRIDGVDGAAAMLRCGEDALAAAGLGGRIRLIHGYLPGAALPEPTYDAVFSNSLLHHLADPRVLWQAARTHGRPGAPLFVMDLMRPQSREEAAALMEAYAADEPAVLREDFYNSLLAAYRPEEVRAQLTAAGLEQLEVTAVSDRHLVVRGHLPAAG